MSTYKIVRMYGYHASRVTKTGLSLEEAQEHCSDPETSSSTAVGVYHNAPADIVGPWFDGYEEES